MKMHEKIEMNPKIMFGKPVIKNTRITVEHILRKLSGGMTIEEIIKDHPHLTREDTVIHHQLLDGRVFVHLGLVLFVPGSVIRLRMP